MALTRGLHRYDKRTRSQGLPKLGSPQTVAGAFRSLQGTRFHCAECQTVQSVADVTAIEQHLKSYSVDCVLACNHTRSVTIAVRRPKAEREEVEQGDYEISRTIDQAV
jgi:hypothetical protein